MSNIELKNKNLRLSQSSKIKIENNGIATENIFKLKKTIDSVTKEKKT